MTAITHNKIIQVFALLAGCLFFAGLPACTERMTIDTEDSPPRLVIYGYITTDTMRHSIKITRSNSYFATVKPAGISHAVVRISSEGESYLLTESDTLAGLYQTADSVFGTEGKTYHLSVTLDFDDDGQTEEYEASSYLPAAPAVDSIGFSTSVISSDFVEVRVWGRLPEQDENYLSFHIWRNLELMNDSLDGFSVLDDKYINGKVIEDVTCFFLDQEDEEEDEKLTEGDLVTVRIDGITKEYATFIENAQSELWGTDPLFSGPPANVETNITSKAPREDILISGFFTAYSGKSASTTYWGIEN